MLLFKTDAQIKQTLRENLSDEKKGALLESDVKDLMFGYATRLSTMAILYIISVLAIWGGMRLALSKWPEDEYVKVNIAAQAINWLVAASMTVSVAVWFLAGLAWWRGQRFKLEA